ncbi:MAG TPA: hypothetical protein VKH81_12000 [Candidatus Angelobacter sp.]|nr:hypothetical protein [Candidatus Angelobacter sp.]
MQTLNVGAGRTDEEYKAAEVQRLADLRSDVQTYAMYFFVAAGLAGLGTGLLPVLIPGLLRLGDFDLLAFLRSIVSIGSFDLLAIYGRDLLQGNILLLRAAAAIWVGLLVGLGFAARKGQRWAFWIGVVLYCADMVPSMLMSMLFGIFAVGLHGFFVMQWFKGQRALGELKQSSASKATGAASS